jgi:hypothetical protein
MRYHEIITELRSQKTNQVYHGTSTAFLRSILKTGLNPDVEQRSWVGGGGTAGESFGGVYLTADEMIAGWAADAASRTHGGEPMLITVQYVLGSGGIDEDEVFDSFISHARYAVVENDYASLLGDAMKLISGSVTKKTQRLVSKLLMELVAYFKKKPMQILKVSYDVDEKVKADPHFRDLVKQIIESTRVTSFDRSTNVRVTRPIGFSGKTRILQIKNIKTGEIYYPADKNKH